MWRAWLCAAFDGRVQAGEACKYAHQPALCHGVNQVQIPLYVRALGDDGDWLVEAIGHFQD